MKLASLLATKEYNDWRTAAEDIAEPLMVPEAVHLVVPESDTFKKSLQEKITLKSSPSVDQTFLKGWENRLAAVEFEMEETIPTKSDYEYRRSVLLMKLYSKDIAAAKAVKIRIADKGQIQVLQNRIGDRELEMANVNPTDS